MPAILTPAKTFVHLPSEFNIHALDATLRSDGAILVALGGTTSTLAGQMQLGVLDPAAMTLTGVSLVTYDQAPGGLPFTDVAPLELVSGPGLRVTALLHLPEHGGTGDANGALLLQRIAGSAALGAALPVDGSQSLGNVGLSTALVFDAAGEARVFYTEQTSAAGPSDGIRMARFDAQGAPLGDPVTVIADHPAGGFVTIDANPVMVDATSMSNGNIALTWTESAAFMAPTFGQPRVMVQVVTASGIALGSALEIDGTSAQASQIVTLTNGKMVVVWRDTTPGDFGIHKGQMLDATGAKLGGVFEISSTLSPQEVDLDLVALEQGGFAVSWRDMTTQMVLGRMFNGNGAAWGRDFALVETVGDFIGAKGAMVSKGGALYTFVSGLNGSVGTGFVGQGQVLQTGSSWGLRHAGLGSAETVTGGALDDVLNGAGGRDSLAGGRGNDLLSGGSGQDRLNGGLGFDELRGGTGADVLTGGGGADTFVFAHAAEGGDRITDFSGLEGDRLVLEKAGFGGATGIAQGETFNAAHRGLFYATSTGELTFDADGSGAAAARLVVRLAPMTALAHDDYLLI